MCTESDTIFGNNRNSEDVYKRQEYDNDNELSVNQVYRYIDELASMGTAQIQFSGGEPLIYPHILEVISYAHSKGIRVVISTSGVTITEQYAKEDVYKRQFRS